MISSLLASVLFAATPDFSAAVTEARRAFIEDGEARVSATPTHRVVSHADGSLELQGGQSLRVSLQAVRREGGPPCRATAKSRAVDATSPRTVRTQRACALEERWTNGREGLEQTFILQRPPAGTGALTLSLSVRGPWHHHDVNGQVFSGPGAVNFLRYGNAFVVRAGRKWPIEVTHVEEGLELKVPRELVEAPGAFPMVIDPIVSTEVPLDPLIGAPVPLPGNEQSPALALNGLDQPMVVWVDDRRQNGTDIFGARLDAAGGLVDLKGIPVALDRLHQLEPTICADGDGWLIAFASERPAGGYLIRGVRVDVNGSPTAPFDIDSGRQPSLASKHNNGDSLIAYVDTSSAVKVSTITSSGSISNEGTSDILQGAASRPFIAATNGEWYVAWESKLGSTPSTIRGMSPSALLGQVFEGPVSPAASIVPATKPTVAYGASFVPSDAVYVYWEQGTEVAGKRVGSLMTDNPISNARSPALVRTSTMQGSKPTLGYISQGQLTLVDLSNTGTMPSRLTVSARAKDLALAANGTGGPIFGAWSEDPALGTDVWAALLGSGAVQPAVVAMGPPSQRLSHVAFAEGLDEGLAVWVEGAGLVLGARAQLQNDGGVVIASPFQIVSNSGVAGLDVAASTADGGYLTVWQTVDGGVQGAISNLDRVVSTLLINQSGATAGPAVAWDEVGSSWVVAWGANAPKTRTVSGTSNQGLAIPRGTGLVSDLDLTCLKGKCLLASERSLTRDV